MAPAAGSEPSAWQRLRGPLAGLLIVIGIPAVLAPALYPVVREYVPFERLLSRLILLMVFVVSIRWIVHDRDVLARCGLAPVRGWRAWLAGGLVVGVSLPLSILLVNTAAGACAWQVRAPYDEIVWRGVKALTTGLAVGFFEEFLFRGCLFVSLARRISWRWSFVLTNLLYAALHFLRASRATWIAPTPLDSFRLILGCVDPLGDWPAVLPRFVGLFLFGCLLTSAFRKSGGLFLPVGIHAGAVFSIKMQSLFFVAPKGGSLDVVAGMTGWLVLAATWGLLAALPSGGPAPLETGRAEATASGGLLRTLRHLAQFGAVAGLGAIACRLPFSAASAVGATLGAAVYRWTGVLKTTTVENLRQALPDSTPAERDRIALDAYRSCGRTVLEMLWTRGASAEALRNVTPLRNREVVEGVLARGRGAVFLTAHYGSWELLGLVPAVHLGTPMTIIVKQRGNLALDRWISQSRGRFGNVILPSAGSARAVIHALRGGQVVGMLGDQGATRDLVQIDMLGLPFLVNRAPAWFSLAADVPLVMLIAVRGPGGLPEVVFEEVDRAGLPTRRADAVRELSRRHAAVLERYVRLDPGQWLWMYRRNRTTAAAEPPIRSDACRDEAPHVK